jgi:UDP-N-acetylmuramate: L-alanyl-gamma-D-glutamyl-meso-diaminopimelate ligase
LGGKQSKYAIFEGDEYDCAYFDKAPKFLRYMPTSAIITSIELDHIDLYPTFEDYKQAFQFLVEDLPKDGYLFIHESAIPYIDLSLCSANVSIYGSTSLANVKYTIISTDSSGTTFSLHIGEKTFINIHISLFGEYNVANASAVFALCIAEGLPIENIYKGIETYSGVKERQEVIGIRKGNITVVRDFAHHPTAVGKTLQGLKIQYIDRRLVCVFEPRSITSRRKMFEDVYPNVLSYADMSIIVTPPFRPGDDMNNFMDVSVVQKNMQFNKNIIYTAENPDNALKILSDFVKENDVVVFMSNGDFGAIPQKFLSL